MQVPSRDLIHVSVCTKDYNVVAIIPALQSGGPGLHSGPTEWLFWLPFNIV